MSVQSVSRSSDAEEKAFYPHQVVNEIKDYAIFTLNLQGYFTSWNAGAENMFGHTADEIKGQHFAFIFPEALRERELPKHELEVAAQDGKYEAEEWHLRKGGESFWALNVLTAIHDENGKVVSFTKIVKDLTERKRVEDTLYEQSEQLTRVKHDLNRFIYSASHELRAPTCNIEGLLNLLDTNNSTEDIQKISGYLRKSLSTLKNKVDEVCQMANFTHRLEEEAPEHIKLARLLTDIKYQIRDEMTSQGVTLQTSLHVEQFTFVRVQLHLILHQLLLNAVAFTDPTKESYVQVAIREQDKGIHLEIIDNGLGIPAEHKDHVFTLFGKADSGTTGNGLGLYYVKRVVEQAQGTIEVTSQLGEGTTFSIYLPEKQAAVIPEN